jgi:translation initiation factor 2B subunit (eIF-2B alpha/beta/delta family)
MTADGLVREILEDRARGATALARLALQAMKRSKGRAAKALLEARPEMPLLAAVVRLAQDEGEAAARKRLDRSIGKLAERAEEVLPPGARYRIFGSSGTVADLVARAGGVVVGDDERCDVALVGADALLPDGDFVNSKGTADFLRRAREVRAGCFAAAIELKRVPSIGRLRAAFERVPGRLVHAVLTETGLHYPPMGTLGGVEPSWVDRGGLEPHGSIGRCHPHHGADHAGTSVKRRPRKA